MNVAPLELLDKSINKKIKVIMRNSYEISGILKSFDEFVNCVLENASDKDSIIGNILLNGNNICVIVPEVK